MSEKTEQDINAAAENPAAAAEPQQTAGQTAGQTAEQPSEQAVSPEDTLAEEMKAAIEAGDFDVTAFLDQYKAALAAQSEAEAKLTRLQADFDNFRRRMRLDNENAVYGATAETMLAVLPVLDNLERAVQGMKDGPDKEGVLMIARQFLSALQSVGLTEIEAVGADFDPNLHQAVLQVEVAEADKNKITMVLQKGYMLKDRLLRAAMVQVGI